MDEEDRRGGGLAWPSAARAIARNATLLRAICLVVFVCMAVVFSTAGIYLRSWQLQFKIQELKDYLLVSNEPDSTCQGSTSDQWVYGPLEGFMGCEARQREDFTRSDKELFDLCVSAHEFSRDEYCQRGREVRIYVYNVTNPEDVLVGLTPRIVEIGRKDDGGPFVFYKDCKTFNTEFHDTVVDFSEYCYYTYKFAETEDADLRQQIVTVNVGLMEAMGNSVGHLDYVVPVVWGTLGLDYLNATTTTAEDYMRGQLLSFAWPNNFGADFLNEFSPAADKAGFRARDNARALFEGVLKQEDSCTVNGTQYDQNQCLSMANTLTMFAKRYFESFQTFNIDPYGLTYKQGAGLFVRTYIGDLLGYYAGYDDPLSAHFFPRKVSWNVVNSQTQVEVNAEVSAGTADAQNGVLNAGPLGRSTLIANTIEDLGSYTRFKGRTFVTEFDWQGCRPLGSGGEVVVPPDGPYPPQCNGGNPLGVMGSRGTQVKPRVWSLQPGVDSQNSISIFSPTLLRPLSYSSLGSSELQVGNGNINVLTFELIAQGLTDARIDFNCEDVYKNMAQAGVLNRGSDCDMFQGMFSLSSVHNNIPYVWSLPHYYLVESADPTQHPRSNLIGFLTPTGPRYRNMVVVEPESGKVVQSMIKDMISLKLYQDEKNYFFTTHKAVIIPLYWRFDTKNATSAEVALWASFQSSFQGLNAGFITLVVLGGASLATALVLGMLLYRDNSLQSVEEKRKRIQAELASALPPDTEEAEEQEQMHNDFD